MALAHAREHLFDEDPEMRHSLRVIQRQRREKQVGVLVGIVAALAIALGYAYLSYSGSPNTPVPSQSR